LERLDGDELLAGELGELLAASGDDRELSRLVWRDDDDGLAVMDLDRLVAKVLDANPPTAARRWHGDPPPRRSG